MQPRAKLHEFVDSLTPDRLDVIAAWVLRDQLLLLASLNVRQTGFVRWFWR
jgi:hypothetical protein